MRQHKLEDFMEMVQNTKNITTKMVIAHNSKTIRQHRLFYGSSYDRGLDHLLNMWPEIIKKYPDATLDIYYGWDLFDKGYVDNPERMKWKEKMIKLMQQNGITEHGRVSKKELRSAQQKIGIWAYPTHFGETCCITALDCQENGCVPCVINYAGLKETVGSGIRVEGDIYDKDVYDEYLNSLLALMKSESRWKDEQLIGKEFAKSYSWSIIAEKWIQEFKK